MQRSSETIGAIAAALAKAQIELTNPGKSLTGTVVSESPREDGKTFRYAPLSTGLEIVRKCLGKHEIAAVQTTAIDKEAGLIRLTTMLAHASGEWLSSEWPVCPVSETAAPQKLGAALTYARRHALFTLVGIAGDDDTDAPAIQSSVPPGIRGLDDRSKAALLSVRGRSRSVTVQARPPLPEEQSLTRRDELLAELSAVANADELTLWAQRSMPAKNVLSEAHARSVEAAFGQKAAALRPSDFEETPAFPKLRALADEQPDPTEVKQLRKSGRAAKHRNEGIDKSVLAFPEPKRIRDKEHLKFVATQPCLVCGRNPSDAHHIRFAQLRALGRKVSDEFTIPLCRTHHRELHNDGDEAAWWLRKGLEPLQVAEKLWRTSHPLPGAMAF